MKKIKNLKCKIILTALFCVTISLFYILDSDCVFKTLFHIPCLGCGMTRAWLSALHLNFADAFTFHPMFWSVPVLYLFFLKDGRLFDNKKVNTSFIIILAIGFAAVFISRFIIPSQRNIFF